MIMNKMKLFARWFSLAAICTLLAAACSKKDDSNDSLQFEVPSLYFAAPGTSQVISYASHGVSRVYVASRPKGWGEENISLDTDKQQLKITVPEEVDDNTVASSGTITLSGYSSKNNLKSAVLFVGLVPQKELKGPANSFIANEAATNYWFKPVRRDGSELHPASVGLLWQSASKFMQYLYLDAGNRISFYIGNDATHTDEIMRGNALIGAYDADGNLLWSWHVWACNFDPDEEAVTWQNGATMMNRNLGALDNANSTDAEKLASYGLYYQWGRKDPFIGPTNYKFSNGTSATLYITDYTTTALSYLDSSLETGTVDYADQHPLTFITGVEETEYDWQWSNAASAAASWSDRNDPCPYGWHVAPGYAFEGLELSGDPVLDDNEAYGWPLTDGTATSLFMAGGERVYLNGYFQNVYDRMISGRANTAEEAQPWVAHYWTADGVSAQRRALSMCFGFDKQAAMAGAAAGDGPTLLGDRRANGFPVRCVKQ